jgi:hypothetical protein
MAKAKRKTRTSSKKARGSRKKTTRRGKKSAVKRKPAPRAKARRGKKAAVRRTSKKAAPRRRTTRRPASSRSRGRPAGSLASTSSTTRGLGADAGGQSGDTEGLSRAELADSESVEELLEEGQAFEAGVVEGVENAPDADKGEVRTREVPEDDVPQEYLDED